MAAFEGDRAERKRSLPSPMGIRELINTPEPEENWIADTLIPAEANVLLAGYPKSGKTFFGLDLAVAAATGTRFLGEFTVPRRHRVGMIIMEDRPYRIMRRLERLCSGIDRSLDDLEGFLHLWFRPPLLLSTHTHMMDLSKYVEELQLDLLVVDSYAYVSTGDSNSADDVTPQLMALSGLRKASPELTVLLVHHARKTGRDSSGKRLTDVIRNSSAFGAWYDTGIVLSRSKEIAPIEVRTEMRDLAAPDPFTLMIEDEYPGELGFASSGWLRLNVSEDDPQIIERRQKAEKYIPRVREYLRNNDGCSKKQLKSVGKHSLVDAAFQILCDRGEARYEEPESAGKAGKCHLIEWGSPTYSQPSPGRGNGGSSPSPTPVGGDRDEPHTTDEPTSSHLPDLVTDDDLPF